MTNGQPQTPKGRKMKRYWYVKHAPTNTYLKEEAAAARNPANPQIISFPSYLDAKAAARARGWGWVVTNCIRIG